MLALKIVVTFLDVMLLMIFYLFSRNLKWSDLNDRWSIIGFSITNLVYLANIGLIWLNK